MTLNCKDGTLEIDDHVYERSCLVRDLIDNTPNWIAEHSKQEVYDEIEVIQTPDGVHIKPKKEK